LDTEHLKLPRLLQLASSAVPIGQRGLVNGALDDPGVRAAALRKESEE
jgi:hypothetical protein